MIIIQISTEHVNTSMKTFLQWLAEIGGTSGAFGISSGSPMGITPPPVLDKLKRNRKNRFGNIINFDKPIIDVSGSKIGSTGSSLDTGNGV